MKKNLLFYNAFIAIIIALFLAGCNPSTGSTSPSDNSTPETPSQEVKTISIGVKNKTSNSITLTWTPPAVSGYTHILIFKNNVEIAYLPKSTTTYTAESLNADTLYTFTFMAVSDVSETIYAQGTIQAKTSKNTTEEQPTIKAPTNLVVNQTTDANGIKVTATWTAPSITNLLCYTISIKKEGSSLAYKSDFTYEAQYVTYLENGNYTIEVSACTTNKESSEPVSKDFTVSSNNAPEEEILLTGLNFSISDTNINGKGTKDEPYEVVLNDFTGLNISVTPVPEKAEIQNYVSWINNNLSGTNNGTSYSITSFQCEEDQTASITASTYDNDYNTIKSTLYFKIGYNFDSIQLNSENLIALDDISPTITPVYYLENTKVYYPFIKSSTWTSSDESIATVKDGVITALKTGTVTITYKANTITQSINITIVDALVYPESITFESPSRIIRLGDTYTFSTEMTPQNINIPVEYKAFTRSNTYSEESDILEITDTTIKAVETGNAYVFARWKENGTWKYSSNYMYVRLLPEMLSFSITEPEVELAFDETHQIKITLNPEDTYFEDDEVSFTSNNENIKVSDSGLISFVGSGTEIQKADITVKVGKIEKTMKVTYCIPVSSITLNRSIIVLGRDSDNTTISATVLPENASDKTIKWECNNTDSITFDNGTISVKAPGITTITATAGYKKATVSVLVLNTSDSFTLNQTSLKQLTGAGDYNGYYTDSAEKIAYSYTTKGHASASNLPENCGKWDIIGKKGDTWQSSTYVNAGWGYKINNTIVSLDTSGSAIAGNVKLTVVPILVYNKGIPFVLFVHALTNIGSDELTDIKFGSGTDVQIAGNDNAPVNISAVGANLVDETTNMIFSLNCLDGEAVTPVDTLWIGPYNSGVMNNVYVDNRQSITNTDSAIAYSWQNIELDAGETKIFTVRLTFVEDEGGTLEALVY